MFIVKFWQELSRSSRIGFSVGLLLILGVLAASVYWLLPSSYETVLKSTSAMKIAVAVREIEKLKVPYRVTADGTAIEVPSDQAGRVRVGVADGASLSTGDGFELFNNTDFSTTEFTQKINYQRALQGELARTVSSIEGVSSARVHLVMPDSGFLRRQNTRPTAAVHVMMMDGAQLSMHQVQGIQRLVASAIPDIKQEDIAVVDQEGYALTKNRIEAADGAAPQGGIEVKREVDAYFEGKLKRLLADLDPKGDFSVSVDVSLNLSNVKVVTEDVLPAGTQNSSKETGVLVRERVTQRSDGSTTTATSAAPAATPTAQSSSTSKELEYKVGRRVEEVLTAPGGIERLSIAVVARTASNGVAEQSIRDLVSHAAGVTQDRGDSVAVVVLTPNVSAESALQFHPPTSAPTADAQEATETKQDNLVAASNSHVPAVLAWLIGLVVLAGLAWFYVNRQRPAAVTEPQPLTDVQLDTTVARITDWLNAQEVARERT